jgi:hypothetical protein
LSTTFAPCAAKALAIPKPMPLVEPVTSAVLPVNIMRNLSSKHYQKKSCSGSFIALNQRKTYQKNQTHSPSILQIVVSQANQNEIGLKGLLGRQRAEVRQRPTMALLTVATLQHLRELCVIFAY